MVSACSTYVIPSGMERVSMETEGWVQRSCEYMTMWLLSVHIKGCEDLH